MEEKIISNNGVEIFGYRSPYLHSFCLCLYVKAGPLYEDDSENGISHFFEHTAFRSINTALDGKLYKKADLWGLNMNALTYNEFIQFKITGASSKFKEAAEILTEIFTPFSVPKKEIDIERKRIKSELREKNEKSSLDCFSQKIVWEGTRLSNSILGKNAVLDKIGVTALSQAQKKLLAPNNIFFYVTGNYGEDGLCYLKSLVEKKKMFEKGKVRKNIAEIPASFGKRGAHIEIKSSSEHAVSFSFDMCAEKYTAAECYLLYDLLFSGECSKLFKGLSNESGMVYSYDATIDRYANIGTLSFVYEIGANDVVKSVEKVVEILKGLKNGIGEELEYVKTPNIISAEFLPDDPEEINYQLGYEDKIMGKPFVLDIVSCFERVTAQRMTEIAREIFTKDNLVLTFKENKKRIDIDSVRDVINRL